MEIPFTEAYFGEKSRSHSVLSASCDRELAKQLSYHLDLPGQTPAGFILKSFVSCFLFEKSNYIFARTSADPSAERQGMVFSHAIIVEKDKLSLIDSINVVVSRLSGARPDRDALSGHLDVKIDRGLNKNGYTGFAEKLLEQESSFVVLPNEDSSEAAVFSIWNSMPRVLRSQFSYRTFFSPGDVGHVNVTVVSTPKSMLSRWPVEHVFEPSDSLDPNASVAALSICGQADDEFGSFLDGLEILVTSFGDLGRAGRAFREFKSSVRQASFAGGLRAARLISALVPDPEKGGAIKKEIVGFLSASHLEISSSDILRLRNFDARAFSEGNILWDSIRDKLTGNLGQPASVCRFPELVAGRFGSSPPIDSWNRTFDSVVSSFDENVSNLFVANMWNGISNCPEHSGQLLQLIAPNSRVDKLLADQIVRSAKPSKIEELIPRLMSSGLCLAEVELRYQESEDVIGIVRELVDREPPFDVEGAIDRLLSKEDDQAVLSMPFSVGHFHVLKRAAEKLAAKEDLFNGFDYLSDTGQKIWCHALRLNSGLWGFPPDMEFAAFSLYGRLVAGKNVDSGLLELLASTPAADLLRLSGRGKIWAMLPSQCRGAFLSATIESWIGSLKDDGRVDLEAELITTVSSERCRPLLMQSLHSIPFEKLVAVISMISSLTEDQCASLVTKRLTGKGVTQKNIESMAHLLRNKGWGKLVRSLADGFGKNASFRPLFEICSEMLSPWTRLWMGLWTVSKDDRWKLLEDTAVELFPWGPREHSVWERADGSAADLSNIENGRTSWRQAIGLIRNGGDVSARKLLKEMLENFPNNPKLQYLLNELF